MSSGADVDCDPTDDELGVLVRSPADGFCWHTNNITSGRTAKYSTGTLMAEFELDSDNAYKGMSSGYICMFIIYAHVYAF